MYFFVTNTGLDLVSNLTDRFQKYFYGNLEYLLKTYKVKK